MPFDIEYLEINDVFLVIPKIFEDIRGHFFEIYKESDFAKMGINYKFVQDNESRSRKGVLRGLHYQLNDKAQGKLIRVINGSIVDVAVDLRKSSEHFGKYVKVTLSKENKHMLWIPPGFAHGFLSLENETVVSYKVTNEYSKDHEASIHWKDKDLNIEWEIDNPIVSEKDDLAPSFENARINFV